jgi:hypothetical protein
MLKRIMMDGVSGSINSKRKKMQDIGQVGRMTTWGGMTGDVLGGVAPAQTKSRRCPPTFRLRYLRGARIWKPCLGSIFSELKRGANQGNGLRTKKVKE